MKRTKNTIIYIMGGFFMGLIVERSLVPLVIFAAGTLLIAITIIRFVYRYFLRKNADTAGMTDWVESVKRYRRKQEDMFSIMGFLASMIDSKGVELEIIGNKKEDADCRMILADGTRKTFKVSVMMAELEKTGIISEKWLKENGTDVEPLIQDV